VARELGADRRPLQTPAIAPVAAGMADKLPVTVSAPDLCGRFSGRVIRGVDTRAATPRGWSIAWRAAASAA
jgi:phenylalanyl-tRNA synthetase beta chain